MKLKIHSWLVVLCLILAGNASGAVTAALSPTTVSNTYAGQITLQISGLATGESVLVRKFYDLNTNGVVDANDLLVQQFLLTDGQASVIGGVTNLNVPGDWNPTNGVITAPLYLSDSFVGGFAGKFAYVISSPSNHFSPPLTNFFTVTNFGYGQSISGTVKNGASAVPNAQVFALNFQNGKPKGLVDGVVADNSGNYTLKLPPGTFVLAADKTNLVGTFNNALITLPAGTNISTNLTLTATTRSISGKVYDTNTPALTLPGVAVTMTSTDNLVTIAFTDTNGNFTAAVTASQWKVNAQTADLNLHGYVAPQNSVKVNTGGANATGQNLGVYKANSLFYGSVTDGSGHPLPGVTVGGQDNNLSGSSLYQSDGVSDANGNYVVGAVSASVWNVDVSSDNGTAQYANYLFSTSVWDSNGSGGTNLSAGVAVPQNFVGLVATNQITGHLKDSSNNGISGIQISANGIINGTFFSTPNATTDANGSYTLNVIAGEWSLYVNCGCTNCGNNSGSLSSSYQCPNNTFVPVASSTATNDIIVQPAGSGPYEISGLVLDNNNQPVVGITVYGSDTNGDIFTTETDSSGSYQLDNVGNGSVTVSLDCNGLKSSGYSCADNQVAFISNNSSNGLNFIVQNCGALTISTPSVLPDAIVGQNYSLQFSNSGCNSPFTWKLLNGSQPLPANLTLSSGGLLSGIPAATGTNIFFVQVTDSTSATTNKQMQLAVFNPLAVTNASLPAGVAGVYYNTQLGATGGVPPYAWSPTATLPPWLSLGGADGMLFGTPTNSGVFQIAITVTDHDGNQAQFTNSITVGAGLQITTPSLNNAIVGMPYNCDLMASGGTPPYYWTLAAGSASLPNNLFLSTNGVISGTPAVSAIGTNSFIVQVTDASSLAVTRQYGLIVNPKPTLSGAKLLSGSQFQVNVSGAAGQNYTFQYSINLSNWFTLYVTNPATSSFSVLDTSATNKYRFYRLLIGP